jgi:hypothetical protein
MTHRARLVTVVLAFVVATCATAFGQSDKSTIRGTVKDASGAVVPGAEIALTEVETNLSARTVLSDSNGNFEIPDLKPGLYRLKADLTGFKSFVAEAVRLDGTQTRRIDISLEIGTTTETVTVEAGAAVITTDTGTIGGGVDKRQFADTPLIDVYPSPFAVLTTVPGIQGNGWDMVISGQGRTQYSQGMDGMENDRTGEQSNNMNFFDEVQVVTVNASAENSRLAAYSMTSKRGQSQFHGTLYYKHFNSGLNARLALDPRKTPFIQHEFQAEGSGPIWKDRTFFYAAWMQQRIPLGFFKRASVPTLKMRDGDFSGQRTINDPLTGQPFPNNRIPSSRINSLSLKAQDLYFPLPNSGTADTLTNNYGWTHPFHYDFYQGDWPFVRIDHNVSSKNTLYARWIRRKTPYVLDSGLPTMIWTRLRDHRQIVFSDTHLFSNNLVNTARVGWNSNYIVDGDEQKGTTPIFGDDAVKALGLQGVNRGNYHAQGFPRMAINGVTTISTTAGGVRNDDRDFSYENATTWAKGRHVWKFGGEFKTFQAFSGVIDLPTFGDFNFNGSITGLGYADFLLGVPFSSARLDPLTNRTQINKEFGLFVQDTFKLSTRLTLDYGLRWDYYALPTYEDGLQYLWDPTSGNVVVPQAALAKIHPLYPKTITVVAGDVVPRPDKRNIRPRIAAAYRLKDNFVIRGGYGAFTERIDYFSRIQGGGPFQISESYSPLQQTGQALITFPNPFPTSLGSAAIPSQSVTSFPLQTDNGTIHQYNVSAEREFKSIGFRVSYIGNRAVGLNYNVNINKPRASETAFSASRRPYPQFVNTTYARNDGAQHYDSFQIQALRRVGSFTFNAHWTYSNNMYNFAITEDPYNVTNRWARNPVDRRHYGVVGTVWEMPWGRGRRFLSGAPGIVDHVIGGWRLQTISYFATGAYFSPQFSGSDPSGTNTSGGLPDRSADGNLDGNTRTWNRWFDATAFGTPPRGRFGNAGANTLVGQGINVHHLSLAKRFRVGERVGFTTTAAISDLFNHPHFQNPQNNISNPDPGKFTALIPDYNPEKQAGRHISMKLRIEW